ncbi:MAG TPA: tetratricopeptide repeat protein, partial [Candidatus Binatia bacterium]|nr:tetratricopeptide repeat protein [Candidatus Binatia bacterium]
AAVLLGCALARLPRGAFRPALAAVAVVLLFAAAATARRAEIWRDDFAFWQNAVAAVPEEGFPLTKLGVVLYRRGDLHGAEATYREALGRRLEIPERAVTENNLAQLLLRQRRCAEAEPLFRSALVPGPRFSGPYRGLAECLAMTASDGAKLAEMQTLLERAVALDPRDGRAALLLGKTHLAEGRRDEAVRWLTQATRIAPRTPSAAEAGATLQQLGAR